jgi:Na+/proline symporter
MLGKVLALCMLGAFVLLSALLHTTTPSTIHPVGILLAFVLIYVLALGALTFLLFAVWRIILPTIRRTKTVPSNEVALRRAYLYASVLALAPVMIIAMKSIGQSSTYEVVLVVLFEVVACFYISKQH